MKNKQLYRHLKNIQVDQTWSTQNVFVYKDDDDNKTNNYDGQDDVDNDQGIGVD